MKNEFKGTPGPWDVTTWSDPSFRNVASADYHQITAGDGYADVIKNKFGFEISGYMSYYDAKLIAAAPELLEALQSVINAIDCGTQMDVITAVDDGRVAIAKALGETK